MKSKNILIYATAVGTLLGVGENNAEAKAGRSSKDVQIEALEQRLLQLEDRLEKAEAKALQAESKAAPAATTNRAHDLAEGSSIKQLDQKVKVLERKLEVDKEVADAAKKSAPKLEAGAEGFRISSSDGAHSVRLRGAVQTDAKFFVDDNRTPAGLETGYLADRFELKQARIWLDGTLFKHFDFRIMPDFGKNGSTLLQDAYLDAHYFSAASLNVGKQKTPLSLERLQGDSDGTFLERAYPTQLASNRDVGVMLHGAFAKPGEETVYPGPLDFKNFVSYQLGVFNGSGDNGAASNLGDTTRQDDKEFVGRIWAYPFQHSGVAVLDGLGVGIAGSWAMPKKANTLNNLTSASGGNTIVDYTALSGTGTTLTADGDHYRVYPQAYWFYGPYGMIGEYSLSSSQLLGTKNRQAAHIQQDNSAWQILASYVITGEDNTFQGVRPRHPFDPANGDWGALQLAARWTQLDIDDDTFAYLDPAKSVHKATGWTLGANWYLNRNILIRADYEQTYFDGGAARNRDRPREKVFSTRFQFAF